MLSYPLRSEDVRFEYWCKSPPVWPRITLGAGRVERSRATDAASSEAAHAGRAVRTSQPSGRAGLSRGAGHPAWPNTRYVINAFANSMRSAVAGSTPVKDCASQQLRVL